MSQQTLEQRVREGLMKIKGIEDVFFRDQLQNSSTRDRPFLTLYRNSFSTKRSGDFMLRFCERCLITDNPTGTSHGSPYDYDTHVPLVLWGWKIHDQKIDREVHTVDLAPTIAIALGISYPNSVEGIPLKEASGPQR